MRVEKIKNFSEYSLLVDKFGIKGCTSNDYLQNEASVLIEEGKLYKLEGESNAYLLVEKDGFYRLYYYINDFSELPVFPNDILTTEIIYREASGEPADEIVFLEKVGFHRHLTRDQYSGVYKNLITTDSPSNISIKFAEKKCEAVWAFNLFNQIFDKYTGDYNSPQIYPLIIKRKELILAYENENPLGALHMEEHGSVASIAHIAVSEAARGKHVGKSLVDFFIMMNMVSDKSRYMLWVQQQNAPAVSLYRNSGFIRTGKSSLSMIKN